MPFLHGFRRIIFEYRPLVDEILAVIGIQDPEQAGVTPSTSSYLARHSDKFVALNELLERHVNSSYYKDGISYSLLKVAEQGLVPAAQILLHYGADLSFEDPVTYYTPLHIAVLRSRPDMVELLVRSGADINKRDRIHESSPLDLASEEQERLPCLQRLLQLGADVNAADKHGKTPLLHAMASMDGIQIHNTENIRLLLEGGADVKATMKDGDTAFSSIIFLLGEAVGSEDDEAKLINRFCFRVSQLLVAHGADPSECPSYESLTHTCFTSFKLQYPLLRFLLESGASYNCSQHGPSCWSGICILFDRLCDYLGCCKDPDAPKLITMAESLLDLMIAQSPRIALPRNYELNTARCPMHADRVTALYQYLKQLGQAPPTLKHLCRVFIRQRLRPWPVDEKIKSLPLPDRMKLYLLIHPNVPCEEDL